MLYLYIFNDQARLLVTKSTCQFAFTTIYYENILLKIRRYLKFTNILTKSYSEIAQYEITIRPKMLSQKLEKEKSELILLNYNYIEISSYSFGFEYSKY